MKTYVQGSVGNPAAGADFSFSPSSSDRFKLLTVHATITIASGGGGEHFHFYLQNASGSTLWETAGIESITASSTHVISLSSEHGTPTTLTALNDGVHAGPCGDLWLPPGSKFVSATNGMYSGDQWSNIFYTALVGDEEEHLRWLEQIATGVANLEA